MYEPMDTMQPMATGMHPSLINQGGMMSQGMGMGQQQLPSTMPNQLAARPPVQNQETNVKVPQKAPEKTKWEDISDSENHLDWIYIIIGVLLIEVAVIALARFFPDVFGKSLNIWYNRFKLSAVIADVVIILIGFWIARYVYSEWVWPQHDWNPAYFTGTTVVVQLLHDLLFYFGVIRPIPQGSNAMMDVFKDYAESGGAKILAADSMMMIGSSVAAMALKAAPGFVTVFAGLIGLYIVPYILETRNQYSNIV
jgi:hypothetical protein